MRQKQPAGAAFAREVSVATEMTSDPESISSSPFAGAAVAMGTSVARILGMEQLVSKGQGSGSHSALFLPGAGAWLPCGPEGRRAPPADGSTDKEPWFQHTGGCLCLSLSQATL
ncbi:hypothetical protein STEG23_038012 [Scotinomys teguina]